MGDDTITKVSLLVFGFMLLGVVQYALLTVVPFIVLAALLYGGGLGLSWAAIHFFAPADAVLRRRLQLTLRVLAIWCVVILVASYFILANPPLIPTWIPAALLAGAFISVVSNVWRIWRT